MSMSEMSEQILEKTNLGSCPMASFTTDNPTYNLNSKRFPEPRTMNGKVSFDDAPIKTPPLHGLKVTHSYMHEDKLLSLEDSAEFFDLVFKAGLNDQKMKDLVVFIKAL